MSRNRLDPQHHQKRIGRLQGQLQEKNIDTYLVLNSKNIFYLTGFSFIPTERPIILIVHQGEIQFFVPALEVEHVQAQVPFVKEIHSYFEYPGDIHPLKQFARVLREDIKVDVSRLGAEAPSAPSYWGYQGPTFKEVLGRSPKLLPDVVVNMRILKEPEEIDLIRESSRWAERAHYYLQKFTASGENELEVSIRASMEASNEMRKSFGPDYEPKGWGMFPAMAGYRGQIGPHSAYPHSMSQGLVFKTGDVVVTGATSNVYGYHTELERTMFIGEPEGKKITLFQVMLEAQTAALESARPGLKCSEIDKIARKVIKESGYGHLLRHHTGHGLGIEGHERPFLDTGDDTQLMPGMVFSCEPGIYQLGLGGFRHSDTFVVTGDGIELLTKYPRELSELIID